MNTPPDGTRPRMRMYFWSSELSLAKVESPPALAGVKQSATAEFGAQAFDLTASLVLAQDALNPDGSARHGRLHGDHQRRCGRRQDRRDRSRRSARSS